MRILDQQRESLLVGQRRRLEGELFVRLQGTFAPLYRRLVGEQISVAINRAVGRALALSLRGYSEISLIVSLSILFGHRFLEDPLFPWAQDVVGMPSQAAPRYRMELLRQLAADFVERAEGPQQRYHHEAMARLAELPFEQALPLPAAQERVIERQQYVADRLRQLHPQRCAAIGERTFGLFVERACAAGHEHGLTGARGAALYAGMWLLMGMGFVDDPLQPWAGRCIDRVRRAEPERREEMLHKAIVRHVVTERMA